MILGLLLLLFAAGFARYGEGFAVGAALGVLVGATFWMKVGQYRRGAGHARSIWRSHQAAIRARR